MGIRKQAIRLAEVINSTVTREHYRRVVTIDRSWFVTNICGYLLTVNSKLFELPRTLKFEVRQLKRNKFAVGIQGDRIPYQVTLSMTDDEETPWQVKVYQRYPANGERAKTYKLADLWSDFTNVKDAFAHAVMMLAWLKWSDSEDELSKDDLIKDPNITALFVTNGGQLN